MAEICPRCSGTDISHSFNYAHCLHCGVALLPNDDGSGTFKVYDDAAPIQVPGPADTSLATPTATPVYAEQESDRQPAVDTNLEPLPSDAPGGPNEKPAPDLEAVNVAGELSDETPEEKKAGGPADVPRTADLTKTGKPSKETYYDHANDPETADGVPTDEELAVDLDAPEDSKPTKKKRSAR